EILANGKWYGGGGIFGQFSTVAVDNEWAPYVFVHEFGHHIAALADEYYTSGVAYLPPAERVEPWEPNVTVSTDVLKWKDLVEKDTPVPTPWQKEEFEGMMRDWQQRGAQMRKENRPEAEIEALMHELKRLEKPLFEKEKFAGKVGAFEGANYQAKAYYRSEVNCIMFTRADFFCSVCRRSIERVIDLYTTEP